VETELIILNGVELKSIQSASTDINTELAAIADAIPDNGIIAATPKTNTCWTFVDDIARDGIVTISKHDPIIHTGITDGVIYYFTEIRIA